MHILQVTPTPPGLSETFITDENQTLRSKGDTVSAFAVNPGNSYSPVSRQTARRVLSLLTPRKLVRLPAFIQALADLRPLPRWVVVRALDLAHEIERLRPDAIHVHFVDQTTAAAVLASKLSGSAITATAHARDIFFSPNKWLPAYARHGVRFIAVCRYNRDELVLRGVPISSIAVVPCGTRVPTNLPARDLSGAVRVLVVGRLVEKKGIDDLLRALHDPSVSEHVTEVRIVGDGPARSSLESLAHDGPGQRKVTFLGAVPRDGHDALYAWANLACLPCKVARDGDRDSMPVAIKEAVAQGLPVLTTTAVGIPEMLDSHSAILAEPANPAQLGRAIIEYARMPTEERQRLAAAGGRRIAASFALNDTVESLRDQLAAWRTPTVWDSR